MTIALPAPSIIPLPAMDSDTQGFWDAARRRQLTYGRCPDCGKAFFYPRPFCPFCHCENAELAPAAGKGEIYSFSVIRRSDPPYVVALVRLAEGPVMFTNIVDSDPERLAIGQPVEVVFAPSDGGPPIPMFRSVA